MRMFMTKTGYAYYLYLQRCWSTPYHMPTASLLITTAMPLSTVHKFSPTIAICSLPHEQPKINTVVQLLHTTTVFSSTSTSIIVKIHIRMKKQEEGGQAWFIRLFSLWYQITMLYCTIYIGHLKWDLLILKLTCHLKLELDYNNNVTIIIEGYN